MTSQPLQDSENAPGGRAALARGCVCSVLANAAFRAGSGDEPPLIEPGCPVHTAPRDAVLTPDRSTADAPSGSRSVLEPGPAVGSDPADPWTP